MAEATARELGRISLEEALELVLLYAAYEPAKLERAALRWFDCYIDEGAVSLLKAQLALSALESFEPESARPGPSCSRSWHGVSYSRSRSTSRSR